MSTEHLPVAVIGAGFAGLAMAVRLRERGITDFTILERNDDVGGTWLENTYPGCACDVASSLYSFSFEPNPRWSRFFSAQPEILGYLRHVADKYQLRQHIRFGVGLTDARWDEDAGHWRIATTAGYYTADHLVGAMGMFGDPVIPEIPGIERFEGTVFHSLHWPQDFDPRGRRVAVVGTGPSAIQFVPAIQPDVEHMTVFQRTPPWILPRFDRATFRLERLLMRRVPGVQRLQRLLIYAITEALGAVIFVSPRFGSAYHAVSRWHIRRQLADHELRDRVTPSYVVGCKRAILSDLWFPAIASANVDLVDGSIAEVREHGVVDAGGREHPVDTIIYGTGFEIPQRGIDLIHGRDGHSIGALYDARPSSYNGMALAGFPNYFQFFGAFGVPANQSAVYMIEAQAGYIADALDRVRMRGSRTVEVRRDAQDAFVREAEARSVGTVWLTGGCRSYYQTPSGGNNGLWPDWSFRYADRVASFDEEAYDLTG